ncbi:MAG: hypothetical protein GWN58_12925, partial [Anaerolineae bacterium]|nr:hypothetical protein [Anaerolineae bacterium]
LQAKPQNPEVGETLRVIPPELLEAAKRRLAEGSYSHFATCAESDDHSDGS